MRICAVGPTMNTKDVHPLSAPWPDRTEQIRLFSALGQLQREIPIHALGTLGRQRAEAQAAQIAALISALIARRRSG